MANAKHHVLGQEIIRKAHAYHFPVVDMIGVAKIVVTITMMRVFVMEYLVVLT